MAERSDSPDGLQWSGVHRGPLRAGEWVRANVSGGSIAAPEVTEGETYINF